MSTQKMISEGMLIAVDYDYLTDDGRIIRRVTIGRSTIKWQVEGEDYLYRSLWEAYNNCKY